MIPGMRPTLNMMITGTSSTKLGMVCRKSSTGLSIRSNRSLRAARTPRGMPQMMAMTTATMTWARVSIDSVHIPRNPRPATQAVQNVASGAPPSRHPASATASTTTGQAKFALNSSRSGVTA